MTSTNSSSSVWEPPFPEELQRMLPQYEISGILGRGGMGAVYKGRQAKLNRTVAIKVLPETFTKGEDKLNFAKRFEQEAQAMANLDHPAILSVYDFGETAEGQLYFVMEFIDGMDIHHYLQHHGGKLPPEHAIAITAHVLDALGYAHSHGIVHRDIKPANILLNREGRVKIADFGLAKKFGKHAEENAPALTMSNVAVGTPDFVAPEALDSDRVPDHRADLYAVGVMLYQMLTGKLPRGSFQLPSELITEIDSRLDDVVIKAMAADPDHRYASAAAVRADLDLILSQPLPRVESGQESHIIKAAVPVTTSVRGTKKAKEKSKMPVTLGLGAASVLVIGLIVMAIKSGHSRGVSTGIPSGAPLSVASSEKAFKRPKARDKSPSPARESGTGKTPLPPPTAPEPAAPPVIVKSDLPAENTGKGKPAAMPVPVPDPLATLPGLQTRLNGYLYARKTQLTELATKYSRGLDSRSNQAADAGDLKLTTSFSEEKALVEALVKSLADPIPDPRAAVRTPVALPVLPDGSPGGLVTLRQTWSSESEKIRTTLAAALRKSLQALESELTRARNFDSAKGVLAYRESLGDWSADTPARIDTNGTTVAANNREDARKSDRDPFADATKEKPFENSLGMKFVPVPGTKVLFCIHEVRYRDYAAYAAEVPEIDGSWKDQSADGFTPTHRTEDHPVMKVSWDDVQAFCAWLSKKEEKTYRLPTDQEWSTAIGIGRDEKWTSDTTPSTVYKDEAAFPWGNEWPPPKGAGNYSDVSRHAKAPGGYNGTSWLEGDDDTFPTTAPVMSFEPNRVGLYDLSGNVWEWCEDLFANGLIERVMRGGSWNAGERRGLLSSNRGIHPPDHRLNYVGFRIVIMSSRD